MDLRHRIEEQKLQARIAEVVLAARERAGLTQDQLAKRAGTNQSVITRLEEADYQCRSLTYCYASPRPFTMARSGA